MAANGSGWTRTLPPPVAGTSVPTRLPAPAARDPRGLLPTGWLKALWLLAQVAGVAGTLWSPVAATAAFAVSGVALLAWTGLAVGNARRARPSTVYVRAPRPLPAVVAWFAPLVGLAVGIGLWRWLEMTVDTTEPDGEQLLDELRLVVAVTLSLTVVIAGYLPFRALARAAAWTGGSPSKVRRWFWMPLVVSVFTMLVRSGLAIGLDTAWLSGDQSAWRSATLAAIMSLLLVPLVTQWWFGWTAMGEVDRAAQMTWDRRNFPEETLDLRSALAVRQAMQLYRASHPHS
ncbi:MAG: hypothetical protein AAFP84_19320 [Actinomycetota bacterium]